MEGLTIDLFEPGMGPLHRAGLGGLAATILWLDDTEGGGRIDPARRPSGTLARDDRTVTLFWGDPRNAGPFLQKLYELAFDLRDGLIHLPGSYDPLNEPTDPVKAALQQGMSQTILQYDKNRKASGPAKLRQYEIDDKPMRFQHQNLVGYTHRSAWKDLVASKGTLRPWVKVIGTIAPGFVQRHTFSSTTIEQPPGHAIALHFALVGTLSLSLGAKGGALIVPDVENLDTFAERRASLNPGDPKACQISSPADAALQAMVRLRKRNEQEFLEVRRCLAVLFKSQNWTGRQRTRAAVLDVEPDVKALERFAVAMRELPPRSIQASKPDKEGREKGWFWADSVVRPLIAENLASGRSWFENFRSLIIAPDGKTDETRVRLLSYEREGLMKMIEQPWECDDEKKLVEAIHDAMGWRFTAIKSETKYDPKTKKNADAYWNRCNRQMQRWRLAFAGAKTPDDVRNALGDMWSRSVMEAPSNAVLKEYWSDILRLFCDKDHWKLNRDLALLALASYGGGKTKDVAGVVSAPNVDDD